MTLPSSNFLEFRLHAVDLQSEWERCSLLANYVGQSASHEFAQSEHAENLIATVINEVLEMVTNLAVAKSDLSIDVNPNNGELKIAIDFTCKPDLKPEFMTLVHEITENSQDIYFDYLTKTTELEHNFNQLGIAMLVHDFEASITVNQTENDEIQTHVLIQISDKEFAI